MPSKPPHSQNPEEDFANGADSAVRDPLEVALSRFAEEKRKGNAPTVDDYARQYPELADQIRELFPLIESLERWKNDKEVECLKRSIPVEFSLDRLGNYKLVQELGRGGMGVVFRAVDSASQRQVAIKLLPWRYAANMTMWKERLQREAATIAALKHPNIVQIYSFAEDQGYYYYVMQLVDGVGLDEIIRQLKRQRTNKKSVRRASLESVEGEFSLTYDSWRGFAKVGEQIASALAYAHDRGVPHNDVKPSNLLIQSNGHVVVTDFGIGQSDEDALSDDDDRVVGTLRYMPPERWTGKPGPLGDVYAIGVSLYELSTQRPVFSDQKRSHLIHAILNREPKRPHELIPDFPLPLENIIVKAMSKSPEKRYPSSQALAEDLRRFIERQPVHASDQSLYRKTVDWWSGFVQQRQKRS